MLRVLLAPLVPRVLRGLLASLDLLDPLVPQEPRVVLVPPDLLAPKAFKALQDPLVLPALKAFRASPGLLAPLVLPVALAQPDPRVPLEPVSPDLQVPRAPRVLRVLLAVALPVGQRRPQHTRLSLVIGFWPTLLVVRSRLHFRPRPLLATT